MSQIPDPTKKRGEKIKISSLTFFGSFSLFQKQVLTQFNLTTQPEGGHKFHKLKIIYFWTGTEKYLSHLTQNLSIFNQKIVTKLEIWVGSGIRDLEKNLSQGQKNKHRIPDPQHCKYKHIMVLGFSANVC